MLHFHAETLKLLDVAPAVSPEAVAELDAVEARIGRPIPASVREWYSLEGSRELLQRYGDDWPLEVSEFGLPRTDTHDGGPHDLLVQDLVPFRYENQAVCIWAFKLDGSDDPPVYVDFDSQFKTWTQNARTFSEHLFAWMWDYAKVQKDDLLIQAQNKPLTPPALKFLTDNFDVGPETYGWPGETQYRFSKGEQRILIWASKQQADWWLAADSEGPLRELVDRVRHCDQVGDAMWSHSEQTELILRRDTI